MLWRAIVFGLVVATLSGITASAGWDDIHRLGRAADDTQAGMNSSDISPALTHSGELMAQAPQTPAKAPKARAPVPGSPLSPGWYNNNQPGGMAILYEDTTWKIAWGNSYVYRYPATDPLYWYAQVVYVNKSNQELLITCNGVTSPSLAKEHMRGTPNSGMVAADETFCSRNPNFTGPVGPGGSLFSWAIFHNVPWQGGEVSLEWGPYGVFHGSSPWVNPWAQPIVGSPPAECPPELVSLGLCQPGPSATLSSKTPNRPQQRNQLPLLTQ